MTRTATGLCIAAALAFAVSAGAQPPTPDQSTTTDQKAYGEHKDKGHEVTVTGCLARNADGTFMLNNAHVDMPASKSTPSTSTTGTTGTTAEASNTMAWKLEGGKDLDRHVGHKIQVTGRTEYSGSMEHPGTIASAEAAPPPTTTTAPPTYTLPTTTTPPTTGTTGTTEEQRERGMKGSAMHEPRLEVTSVKMIAASCQ